MTISGFTNPVTGGNTVNVQRFRNGLRITSHRNVTRASMRRISVLIDKGCKFHVQVFTNGIMGWKASVDDGLA